MATITIKNVPDELYEKLKAAAAANRRSINSEVIMLIERAFGTYRGRAAGSGRALYVCGRFCVLRR